MSPTIQIAQRPTKPKHYKTSTPNHLRAMLEELHLRLRRPPDLGLLPPVLPTLSLHARQDRSCRDGLSLTRKLNSELKNRSTTLVRYARGLGVPDETACAQTAGKDVSAGTMAMVNSTGFCARLKG
jgi:hypothetical protein